MRWAKVKDKYVRERMDVEGQDIVDGRRVGSHATITLANVWWDPALVK